MKTFEIIIKTDNLLILVAVEALNKKLAAKELDLKNEANIASIEPAGCNKSEHLILRAIARGMITEREIQILKNRLNQGKKVDYLAFYDHNVYVTPLDKKGLIWLKNKDKTARGVIRKNSPFDEEQRLILEGDNPRFEMRYYEQVVGYRAYFMPVYRLITDNGALEYCGASDTIQIFETVTNKSK